MKKKEVSFDTVYKISPKDKYKPCPMCKRDDWYLIIKKKGYGRCSYCTIESKLIEL